MPRLKHNIGIIRRLRVSSYVSGFLLFFLFVGIITPFYVKPEDIEAATGTAVESSITFTSGNTAASADLWVDSPDGTAAYSNGSQKISFSITTNNYTGYKVYIANPSSATTLTNDASSGFSAISSNISASTFDTSTSYNNKWGLMPNYYNSTSNSGSSALVIAPPTANGGSILLRDTTSANTSAHHYSVGVAVRSDFANTSGNYSATNFVISYVANPVGYYIVYNEGHPTNNVYGLPGTQLGDPDYFSDTSMTLDSTIPYESGGHFIGWCSVEPTRVNNGGIEDLGEDECSGKIYQPGATYGIDQTTDNMGITLFAMWDESGCNPNATTASSSIYGPNDTTDAACLQDINDTVIANMVVGDGSQYKLYDKRDRKMYSVSRLADGRVWMTQNLDLDLSTSKTLKHSDTDLGWTVLNTAATWTPSMSTVSSSWERSTTSPFSYDAGEIYYYTHNSGSTDVFDSLDGCSGGVDSLSGDDSYCGHFHAGNYYNWYAAVAANSSSDLGSQENAVNSICPAGWRLPDVRDYNNNLEVDRLWYMSGYTAGVSYGSYTAVNWSGNGYVGVQTNPIYLTSAGRITAAASPTVSDTSTKGYYWTSLKTAYDFHYDPLNGAYPAAASGNAGYGMSVRCVARINNPGITTFRYNSNGGTGTMTYTTITGGDQGTLRSNTFTRSGYSFNGWNTKGDGTGTSYENGAVYYAPAGQTESIMLYAQWKKTVTFAIGDSNIETVIVAKQSGKRAPQYVTSGQPVTLDVDTGEKIMVTVVPKAGYKLDSWVASSSGQSGTFGSGTLLTDTFTVGGTATDPTWTVSGRAGEYTAMTNSSVIMSCVGGTKMNVRDPRDDKSYTVGPITVSGTTYCYMLSNLRLEGGTTINSANSDVTANFTLPSQTTWTSNLQNHYCEARMRYINNEYYYNWYAATANPTTGVSNSTSCATEDRDDDSLGSICPKGWTLPTYATSGTLTPASLWSSGINPGYLATTGYFYSGSQFGVGSAGRWWSSARNGSSAAYSLYFSGTNVMRSSISKYYGLSVRCMISS